jgi:hypothetical protein
MAVRNLNDFYSNFKESSRFNQLSSLKEDVSRCDSASRRKLKATALAPFIDDLIPKRNRVQSYPKSRIKIKGKNPFMNS